jgi:hypothetical protein
MNKFRKLGFVVQRGPEGAQLPLNVVPYDNPRLRTEEDKD